MADETKIEPTEQKTRRAFVSTAAQVAVTAPAVGLLLSASTTPAGAQILPTYVAVQNHVLDDFTFGNTDEDIDGGPSLDDVT
jgi:hypothetical protein